MVVLVLVVGLVVVIAVGVVVGDKSEFLLHDTPGDNEGCLARRFFGREMGFYQKL